MEAREPTRRIFEYAEKLREHVAWLRPPGTIEAGSLALQCEALGEALHTFLRLRRQGADVPGAVAGAQSMARLWCSQWNRRREHQVHVWVNTHDARIEALVQAAYDGSAMIPFYPT